MTLIETQPPSKKEVEGYVKRTIQQYINDHRNCIEKVTVGRSKRLKSTKRNYIIFDISGVVEIDRMKAGSLFVLQ